MSVADTVKAISEHAGALVRLEFALARREVIHRASALGRATGLAVAVAVVGVLGVGFALAGAAAGLAEVIPTWVAILAVAGALLIVAAILAVAAVTAFRKGTPPLPTQAMEEARVTVSRLRDGEGKGVGLPD
jgi:hypothetical protein